MIPWLLPVTGVMHEADNAYSIRSTWLCYRLDRFLTLVTNGSNFTDIVVHIFTLFLDMSFLQMLGVERTQESTLISVILECFVLFSGVILSIRSSFLIIIRG